MATRNLCELVYIVRSSWKLGSSRQLLYYYTVCVCVAAAHFTGGYLKCLTSENLYFCKIVYHSNIVLDF